MISPITVMRMLGERKVFISNHPEFFDFIVNTFGGTITKDTVIEVRVTKPGEETESTHAIICESDLKLMKALREVIH